MMKFDFGKIENVMGKAEMILTSISSLFNNVLTKASTVMSSK